jgi:transposase-like protein
VKLVASDAHDGLKAAATKVPGATKQRLPRAFSPHPSSPGGKPGRRLVAAFIDTAFAQPDAASAKTQWRQVADHMRPKLPKLAVILDDAEEDVLAHMSFPKQRWTKLHLTNPRGCSVLEAIRCFHPHGACGGRKRVYPAGRERDSIRDIFSSEDVPHAPVSAFTFGATNRP